MIWRPISEAPTDGTVVLVKNKLMKEQEAVLAKYVDSHNACKRCGRGGREAWETVGGYSEDGFYTRPGELACPDSFSHVKKAGVE